MDKDHMLNLQTIRNPSPSFQGCHNWQLDLKHWDDLMVLMLVKFIDEMEFLGFNMNIIYMFLNPPKNCPAPHTRKSKPGNFVGSFCHASQLQNWVGCVEEKTKCRLRRVSIKQQTSTSIFQGVLFGSKGWCMDTPYHPFSTLWKIQVDIQSMELSVLSCL